MKEDNISQLGDYDASFCEQQYTHGSCDISLFKFKSFDQFNNPPPPPPQTASNFRHLLSCGTIEISAQFPQLSILFSNYLRALKFLAPSTFQNNSNVICSLSLNPKKVIHDLNFGSIILAWTLEHTYNDLIGLILLVSQCQTTSNMQVVCATSSNLIPMFFSRM